MVCRNKNVNIIQVSLTENRGGYLGKYNNKVLMFINVLARISVVEHYFVDLNFIKEYFRFFCNSSIL